MIEKEQPLAVDRNSDAVADSEQEISLLNEGQTGHTVTKVNKN